MAEMAGHRPHRPVFVQHHTSWCADLPRHAVAHGHASLALYTAGRAEFEQRGRLTLTAGDVLLIPAGEPHRMLASHGVEAWGLGFDVVGLTSPDLVGLLEPFERVRAGAAAVVPIPAARQEHLRGLLRELEREIGQSGPMMQAQVQRSLLTLVLAEVARAADWTRASAAPPLVAEALRFIERNCLAPISLRDVAAALGRSPAHLTTALRRATGRTAQRWILAGRLAEARRRLLAEDSSIEVIAAQVGYLDPSSFIRMFRREHGLSPAAWRAAQRRPVSEDPLIR